MERRSMGGYCYYITTPIYYVNDRPHIGHCYTTIVADVAARFMRMSGRDVFFLTGTDEHAEKVVESAARRGTTAQAWADENAVAFREAFAFIGSSHDDFIRTTEARHTSRVREYIEAMRASGDVYLGDYVGWYDPSQEEYLTESVAREHEFRSPVTGGALVKRTEKNYFFALSKYADRLRAHIGANPGFIQPSARRNEVLGRLDQGLSDVPISRGVGEGDAAWGILMPGDDGHRVYVWIDALFNYLSTVDAASAGDGDRTRFWPASVHLIAKDILWFHAVIWPCMLMALGRALPDGVYAHSFWIREGRKMSKSLGNFIDLGTIERYCGAFGGRYGVDAWRWFMVTQGPMGATDADFVHDRYVETYNSDLANGIGNASSRVTNMVGKYFGGSLPADASAGSMIAGATFDLAVVARERAASAAVAMGAMRVGEAVREGLAISNAVDAFINETVPFKLAKDASRMDEVGSILYRCVEALRIAGVILSAAMPASMGELLRRLGELECDGSGRFVDGGGSVVGLDELTRWGRLEAGTRIEKGEGLFPRADSGDLAGSGAAGEGEG